ncbi:hypothetical protein DCS_00245 [Drechmeria coniospora]|uniref:Uncharacterized protein n=1 Tax=Drechmeria coniospora TaxID=98403 RepID=A0A151GPS1_DRECN|nr:hypothetical protein DCS_00245 [Drechmeria coniospora]KYK59115.1 hypothetical protein DCS_00245 [Drechmeria coniospora]ODA77867.1 hypothetical protein RJ55_06470 [Drechmeria coniospora]
MSPNRKCQYIKYNGNRRPRLALGDILYDLNKPDEPLFMTGAQERGSFDALCAYRQPCDYPDIETRTGPEYFKSLPDLSSPSEFKKMCRQLDLTNILRKQPNPVSEPDDDKKKRYYISNYRGQLRKHVARNVMKREEIQSYLQGHPNRHPTIYIVTGLAFLLNPNSSLRLADSRALDVVSDDDGVMLNSRKAYSVLWTNHDSFKVDAYKVSAIYISKRSLGQPRQDSIFAPNAFMSLDRSGLEADSSIDLRIEDIEVVETQIQLADDAEWVETELDDRRGRIEFVHLP